MAIAKWISFAQPATPVPDTPVSKPVPIPCTPDGKRFGLENFGNTCYANSVLQALYFCTSFRELVIQHTDPYASLQDLLSPHFAPTHPPASPVTATRRKPDRKPTHDPPPPNTVSHPPTSPVSSAPHTLFSALRALYIHISQNPADKGTIAPRAFIEKLRELNEGFRNTMHHDAHEFLNYLLNRIVEEVEEEKKRLPASGDDLPRSLSSSSSSSHPPAMVASASTSSTSSPGTTFIHQIFEGTLTSETRCLTCENVSSRDESFLDLSIDIEQNSSVTACLRQFSASEMLCQKEKFFCDACCDLQEAERRMKIKRLPNVLALHLKRFKYQEDVRKHIKLTYRVAFPLDLRLFNTVDDISNPDRLYELFAIVVHIGNGPNHGHYVSIIKTMDTWLIYDDETVDSIRECDIPKYFGDSNSGSAYVLYYQALDIDLATLGLRPLSPEPVMHAVPQPEQPHSRPTDSPTFAAQSVPPLPPGLADESKGSTPVPEALPRPTTPLIPVDLPPSPKSPRKVPSQILKVALGRPGAVGHGSSHNDPVLRPSRSVLEEKLSPMPKPTLSPIVVPPKEEIKPLESHSASAINGKEKDTERSMMGWFRRRSFRNVKSRPNSDVNADGPPLPHGTLVAPSSPVRNQSISSSSNSSKDSRRPLDSPVPGHYLHVSPLSNGNPPPLSRVPDGSSFQPDLKLSSASASPYTTPMSPSSGRPSQSRPLPPIPASPQTPKVEASPLSNSIPISDGRRTHQRHPMPLTKNFDPPSSPRSPGRPATSVGSPIRTHSPSLGPSPSNNAQVHSPDTSTSRPDTNHDNVIGRPKSAHASYGLMFSPPATLPPPMPLSPPGPIGKLSTRKLSLTAPRLGFGRRDKDKH